MGETSQSDYGQTLADSGFHGLAVSPSNRELPQSFLTFDTHYRTMVIGLYKLTVALHNWVVSKRITRGTKLPFRVGPVHVRNVVRRIIT